MSEKERLSRRKLLQFGIVGAIATVSSLRQASREAKAFFSFEALLGEAILLEEYRESIAKEKARIEEIVSRKPLFNDFKTISLKDQLEDFQTYYAFWRAGEAQFGVPWLLLWITQLDETNCSRAEFPERNGHLGGMQRNPEFYSEEYVKEAVSGWEFLKWLPQRYLKEIGSETNDYEEIFFAARKIGEKAKEIMAEEGLNFEESCLKALDNYCSSKNAERRRKQYRIIRTLVPQWD